MSEFALIEGSTDSSILIHIPHSSRVIPQDVRADLLLSDEVLKLELDEVTDSLTDQLAHSALEKLDRRVPRPALFINQLSRFVIDPERFPDDREAMNKVGMGAVYRKTTTGAQLRDPSFQDSELLDRYFHPYSAALADAVSKILEKNGRVVIIDLHSYRARQHRNAINHGQRRPAMCIGTDPFHTPRWLFEIFQEIFNEIGDCYENEPYAGTYIPLRFYQVEPRVTSIMMETRADTFLDENLAKNEGFERVATALAQVLTRISGQLEHL